MSIIKCNQCGQDISDKAKVCPHCGNQIIRNTTEEDTIVCEECGMKIPKNNISCPRCGWPVPQTDGSAKIMSTIPGVSIKNNGKSNISISSIKMIAIIVAIVVFVAGGVIVNKTQLRGDDKVAYNLVVKCADKFKDPSSVRLVSGTLGVNKDCLFCGISATNGFGARSTSYYYVDSVGYILQEDSPTSIFTDKNELNIDKINKKLEKTLENKY